jgi:hypothetical protein
VTKNGTEELQIDIVEKDKTDFDNHSNNKTP